MKSILIILFIVPLMLLGQEQSILNKCDSLLRVIDQIENSNKRLTYQIKNLKSESQH